MTIERKFIDLKDLKVSEEGPGTIEGYRSKHSVIDEGGDLILPGFFADVSDEYMRAGFTAHSHDWAFDKAVGFPIRAHEDDQGWYVTSQFHSTPDAQAIRTKAKERMEAGKQVGFSFGYSVKDSFYIEPQDYDAKLPQYIRPDQLQENLAKAKSFNRIRVLQKAREVIEDSLVTAPMNKQAAATAIKSNDQTKCNCEPGTLVADCPHLKGIAGTESFESFESAGTALEKFAQQMRSNHEIRVKDGRVLSSSNRAKVRACKESLVALIADLDDLLAISEPKPKEKEIDVEALRTQSLRLQSDAMAALA